MALSSMTGFARRHGVSGAYGWAWELKSVNAKGLDLRLRLPPGWDAVEGAVRAQAAKVLARGNVYATLTAERLVRVSIMLLTPIGAAVIPRMTALQASGERQRARPVKRRQEIVRTGSTLLLGRDCVSSGGLIYVLRRIGRLHRIAHRFFRAKRQARRRVDVSGVLVVQREQRDVDDLGGLHTSAQDDCVAAEESTARNDFKLRMCRARKG